MTKPLTFWERISFWLGAPKQADPEKYKCFKCNTRFSLIDLGDGDIICQRCWDNWIPSYRE